MNKGRWAVMVQLTYTPSEFHKAARYCEANVSGALIGPQTSALVGAGSGASIWHIVLVDIKAYS